METRTTTPVTTVMALLEEKLRQQVRQDKPLLVAIDGRCASGKSTLAKDLQKQLDCNVIHMMIFIFSPISARPSACGSLVEMWTMSGLKQRCCSQCSQERHSPIAPMTRTRSVFCPR